ncbi:MAG: metallophosphoesterase family protein [Gemmatimonadota bacterium]|nr:metallophosphoesterase family protein [Gemmatimonadota bacterium]
MRIAALYDIHGNLPALEAVLAEVEREPIDAVVVGGDVLPGPMSGETLAKLDALPLAWEAIRGNGENDILAACRGEVPTRVPPVFAEVLRRVGDELTPPQRDAIAAWPDTIAHDVPGLGPVLFCHATPRDDNEIFTRLTPERVLRPIFDEVGAGVVVCGHTHMQFDRRVGDVRVVNAGSVGMPFGDPGAWWAIVGPDIELRHTPYDADAATARFRASGFPKIPGFDILHPPPEEQMLAVFEAAALTAVRGESET